MQAILNIGVAQAASEPKPDRTQLKESENSADFSQSFEAESNSENNDNPATDSLELADGTRRDVQSTSTEISAGAEISGGGVVKGTAGLGNPNGAPGQDTPDVAVEHQLVNKALANTSPPMGLPEGDVAFPARTAKELSVIGPSRDGRVQERPQGGNRTNGLLAAGTAQVKTPETEAPPLDFSSNRRPPGGQINAGTDARHLEANPLNQTGFGAADGLKAGLERHSPAGSALTKQAYPDGPSLPLHEVAGPPSSLSGKTAVLTEKVEKTSTLQPSKPQEAPVPELLQRRAQLGQQVDIAPSTRAQVAGTGSLPIEKTAIPSDQRQFAIGSFGTGGLAVSAVTVADQNPAAAGSNPKTKEQTTRPEPQVVSRPTGAAMVSRVNTDPSLEKAGAEFQTVRAERGGQTDLAVTVRELRAGMITAPSLPSERTTAQNATGLPEARFGQVDAVAAKPLAADPRQVLPAPERPNTLPNTATISGTQTGPSLPNAAIFLRHSGYLSTQASPGGVARRDIPNRGEIEPLRDRLARQIATLNAATDGTAPRPVDDRPARAAQTTLAANYASWATSLEPQTRTVLDRSIGDAPHLAASETTTGAQTGVGSGAALTHQPVAMTTEARVTQQIAIQLAAKAGKNASSGLIEVALQPEELGRVRMLLSLSEASVVVNLTAERPETMDLMRRHIEMLQQEFRSLGYRDISFNFEDQGQPGQHEPGAGGGTGQAEHELPDQQPNAPLGALALGSNDSIDIRV